MADANKAEVLFLDKLKVAVVDADPSQLGGLRSAAAEDSAIVAVEPERMMYASIRRVKHTRSNSPSTTYEVTVMQSINFTPL